MAKCHIVGNHMSRLIFSRFLSPDEDEGGTAENCLLITVLNAEWDDADCANKHPSICECKLSDCKYS